MPRWFRLLPRAPIVILSGLMSSACGQKGDLYLPPPKSLAPPLVAPVPQSAPRVS